MAGVHGSAETVCSGQSRHRHRASKVVLYQRIARLEEALRSLLASRPKFAHRRIFQMTAGSVRMEALRDPAFGAVTPHPADLLRIPGSHFTGLRGLIGSKAPDCFDDLRDQPFERRHKNFPRTLSQLMEHNGKRLILTSAPTWR